MSSDATRLPVTWLVQRPPPADDSPTFGLLVRACNALRLPLEAIDVTPGQRPTLPAPSGPVIVHGRKTLLETALADPTYRRAVFTDADAFRPSAYLRGWGSRMLNAQQQVMSWDEALRVAEEAPGFVRPDDDDKLFTGAVFSHSALRVLFEQLSARNQLSADSRVVVAAAREVDAEARLFVVSNEIVGGSFYRPAGDPRLPADLVAFAEEAIATWRPHDVFVLDVARADGAYWIVEANGFNGSRFYQADVARIVERVSAYQTARW